jgi:polyisoprenyl-phosphate glycosyltransferase
MMVLTSENDAMRTAKMRPRDKGEIYTDKLVSVVAPAYNEQENVREFYERIAAVFDEINQKFELLIVDNGSHDNTLDIIKELHERDPRINFISLSRNFGYQGGVIAGLKHARGDIIVCMDSDLQHPPHVIPDMLKEWQRGADVVFTLKREAPVGFWRKSLNTFYYRIISKLSGLQLTGGQSDFRLMDRRALNALLSMPEGQKFLRGLSRWIGFSQTAITYDVEERFSGKTKFNVVQLFEFALDGILSFSIFPLRLLTIAGASVAALSLLYVCLVVFLAVFDINDVGLGLIASGETPVGYPSLAAGIFFLGGVQLVGIGILGEYIGRVYNEVKQRPAYIVIDSSLTAFEQTQSDS